MDNEIQEFKKYCQVISVSYTHLDVYKRQDIYKHTKTYGNNSLNEQTQLKSHLLFEHIRHCAQNSLST